MRILGIDPGLIATGFGVVEHAGGRLVHVAHGTVRPPRSSTLASRLHWLYRELSRVIRLLREAGVTILLIEQNMKLAEVVADELHIMVKGRIVYSADPQRFRAEEQQIRTRYLTV